MGFAEVYDYAPGKAAWLAMGLPFQGTVAAAARAAAVADRDVATCGLDDDVAEVAARLGGAGLCVVVHDRVVLGVLEGDRLRRSGPAAAAMKAGPSTFRPSVPKDELAAYLRDHEMDRTLLTTLDGRLVGAVRLADLEG